LVIAPAVTLNPDALLTVLVSRSKPELKRFPTSVGTASQQGLTGFTTITPAAVLLRDPLTLPVTPKCSVPLFVIGPLIARPPPAPGTSAIVPPVLFVSVPCW
jgi:hypothetical protein